MKRTKPTGMVKEETLDRMAAEMGYGTEAGQSLAVDWDFFQCSDCGRWGDMENACYANEEDATLICATCKEVKS